MMISKCWYRSDNSPLPGPGSRNQKQTWLRRQYRYIIYNWVETGSQILSAQTVFHTAPGNPMPLAIPLLFRASLQDQTFLTYTIVAGKVDANRNNTPTNHFLHC